MLRRRIVVIVVVVVVRTAERINRWWPAAAICGYEKLLWPTARRIIHCCSAAVPAYAPRIVSRKAVKRAVSRWRRHTRTNWPREKRRTERARNGARRLRFAAIFARYAIYYVIQYDNIGNYSA